MALSNVKSATYRAAGGRAWNRVKGGYRGIVQDGPVPEFVTQQRFRTMDANDANIRDKERVRAELEAGYDPELVTVIPAGKSGLKKKKRK